MRQSNIEVEKAEKREGYHLSPKICKTYFECYRNTLSPGTVNVCWQTQDSL